MALAALVAEVAEWAWSCGATSLPYHVSRTTRLSPTLLYEITTPGVASQGCEYACTIVLALSFFMPVTENVSAGPRTRRSRTSR